MGPGWKLVADDATKTTGVLALRRVGKTYTASVMAEEFYRLRVPWVALDPTGAWWGLRSNAAGTGPGIPVVILGGAHGDIPLEETAGKFVAELVLDEPGWYVIDFSLFESAATERRFATDFAERLYRRKLRAEVRTPLHLFVDEADRFVPQRPPKGEERMLGAFEALVRRGGITGIGTTLVSQRAAVVNKNVLEQIDQLVMLRTTGPNDRNALERYLKANATPEQHAEWAHTIVSLPTGHAWRWEPHGDTFEQVTIRERQTFNSSATPKSGARPIEPSVFAKIDLGAIKERMAASIERAKADDPVELRKEIARLKRELAANPAAEPERIVETVERLPEELPRELERVVREALHAIGQTLIDDIAALLGEDFPAPRVTSAASSRAPKSHRPASPGDARLGKRERAILTVLAQYPDGRTESQIAFLTGYSPKASTIGAGLSALRKAGYVDGRRITPAGVDALGSDFEPLPSGRALLEYWRGKVGKRERLILDALLEVAPSSLTHDELAEQCGYSSDASTIGAGMSNLRKLEIVEGWAISPTFLEAIA